MYKGANVKRYLSKIKEHMESKEMNIRIIHAEKKIKADPSSRPFPQYVLAFAIR
jgi:hypothetical protein